MHKSSWDDLRYVLAVAEHGSVSAAARVLEVNHATVLRRVAAFEAAHNATVFERSARGYVVAPDRTLIIDAMREVAAAVYAVDRVVAGSASPLHGRIRITSTDTFCTGVLPPILAEMKRGAEMLRLEIICNNAPLDLGRLHADIAVRPAVRLPEDLKGDVAARLGFAVYAAPVGAGRWLGLSGILAKSVPAAWMAAHYPGVGIIGASDSFVSLREMAASGLGQAVLPCVLGDGDPRLKRQPTEDALPEVDIWVASHRDLADVPRIRQVRTALAEKLSASAPILSGRV